MSRSIFILGCGIMQIPAIRIARDKGWTVYSADGNPDAPGVPFCSEFFSIDLKDTKALLKKAKEIKGQYGLDGIFTAGTDFSTSVAYVSEALSLPGINYETALRASDKVLMRRCFDDYGVPSPRFLEVDGSFRSRNLPEGLDYPVVVKPVDSMGARGVERIDDNNRLLSAVLRAVSYSRSGRALIEEYIEGNEYSLDAVIYNGEVTICGFADRHIFYPPYFIEMGHTMPTEVPDNVRESVIDVFTQGIKALGIDNGSAKGDLRSDGKRTFVGEIAARLSGGFMSGWTFPYSSGVSAIEAAMNIAVGIAPESLAPVKQDVSCERAVLSIPGIIKSISYPDPETMPHVKDIFVHCNMGDSVVFPRNNVEKCLNVISSHQERGVAVDSAEKACSLVCIQLEPENDVTMNFLQDPAEWIPPAYVIQGTALDEYCKQLKRMFFIDFNNRTFPEVTNIPEIFIPGDISQYHQRDWNHRSLADTLDGLQETALFKPASEQVLNRVNCHFWIAVLRGGYSGGLWFLERLQSFDREKSDEDAVQGCTSR